MLIQILILIIGFGILIKAANYLVEGASSLAIKLNISQTVIGLTIVAFGTSAPELIVNVLASVRGSSGITIGNVVGSNIANILLILGVSSIIKSLHAEKNTVWKEIPFSLLAALVLLVLANDSFFYNSPDSITSGDGIILLFFFIIFMIYVYEISKDNDFNSVIKEKITSVPKSIFFITAGVLGLFIGGKLIVDSAITLAKMMDVSEAIIGFTIVAFGTSLPELATSAVAAYKGNDNIAVGNIVGSNILNIFWILGVSAIISSIPFSNKLNLDLIFLVFISTLLFFTMFTGKKKTLERWEGILFVGLYILYMLRFIVFES